VIEAKIAQQAGGDAAQSLSGIGDDGKHRHQGGAHHQRERGIFHPDDDQRGDGDDRRHLQKHDVGKQGGFHKAVLHQDKRHRGADDNRQQKRDQGDLEGEQQRQQQRREMRPQAFQHHQRRRHQKGRDAKIAHCALPQEHHRHRDEGRIENFEKTRMLDPRR